MIPAALVSLGGFLALAIVAAQQQLLASDHAVRALAAFARHPDLEAPMRTVSLLGESTGLVPMIVLGTLALWRGRRRWALALPVVMAGTGVLQLALKWAIDRPRPNDLPWGFPSGHTLSAVVFFGLLAYLACAATTRRRWRCAAVGSTASLVAAVALSRLYLEAHWITDVAGGFAVGLAYLLFVIRFGDRPPSSLASAARRDAAAA